MGMPHTAVERSCPGYVLTQRQSAPVRIINPSEPPTAAYLPLHKGGFEDSRALERLPCVRGAVSEAD